jgi:DNA repair ATPase RecN
MVSESQALGVNKLLWVYLKLLHTRMNLNKFLKSIDERDLDNQLAQSRSRIETVEKENGPSKEKMLHSLQDTLQTIQARKDNFRKAKDNFEYVGLELERIATKLTALAELAVNRQDPATITTGVDEVAKSVETTEQTIGDLRVFTGLTAEDEVAPQIMDRKVQERRVRA